MIATATNLDEIIQLIPGYDPCAHNGDYFFDYKAAQRAIDFFHDELVFIEGAKAGQPFILEPWQQAIVANSFGWKHRGTHFRRYREVLIFVARKNGKTPLAAGAGLFMTVADGEWGAQNYCAATSREQATLVFRHARGMTEKNEDLDQLLSIMKASRTIVWEERSNQFKAIPANEAKADGYNGHFLIIDEVHAHPNRDFIDKLVTSTAAREQPLIWYTTTADYMRESICNEIYEYGVRVRDGILEDDAFLPVIYEATADDDWTTPEAWSKANPNLGVSVSQQYLKRQCDKAQESASFENTFKRLHLNMRTEVDIRYIDMVRWDMCATPIGEDGITTPKAAREALLKRMARLTCYGGLDLSTTTDITANVLVALDGDEFLVVPFFWVPADSARKRSKQDRVDYEKWIGEGWIKATPGDAVDFRTVREDIVMNHRRYGIEMLSVDDWQGRQMLQEFKERGIDGAPFGQGMGSMTGPTKELERLILAQRISHGGNPVLRWMASNLTVKKDESENVRPDKKRSPERIDGIVATIMALGAFMIAEKKQPSVYERENRGLVFVD